MSELQRIFYISFPSGRIKILVYIYISFLRSYMLFGSFIIMIGMLNKMHHHLKNIDVLTDILISLLSIATATVKVRQKKKKKYK